VTPARVRSQLFTGALLVSVVLAWLYLAPTQIDGSTRYVITNGVSMEPRFHAGDLAVVRPTSRYRVGDVAAYYSPLLHVVVLHRIHAIVGSHYVFKGDNNSFLDPTRPLRSQLLGTLWLHIPRGGLVLRWIHTPFHAAFIVAAFALLALATGGERRRRRNRRRPRMTPPGAQGPPPVKLPHRPLARPAQLGTLFAVAAAAAVVFLGLAVYVFTQPLHRSAAKRTPYTQQVSFGYQAQTKPSPVYPTGTVSTGQPIFLAFVRQLGFTVHYSLATQAAHQLSGTVRVYMQLSGPSGWTHTVPLSGPARFAGPQVTAHVTVDLGAAEGLVAQVEKLTGVPTGGYTLSLVPHIRLHGKLGPGRLDTLYAPQLTFQLTSAQLQPGGAGAPTGTGSSSGSANFAPSQHGNVGTLGTASNHVDVLSQHVSIAALRWVAMLGVLLFSLLAIAITVARRAVPFDEAARIQSEYGHLIVPVVLGPEGLAEPVVDVPSIAHLVRLAEVGQRLILHSRDQSRDTYLVSDDHTAYRYEAQTSKVIWGDWSDTPRPLATVDPDSQPTAVPSPAPEPVATAAPTVFPPPAFLASAATEAPPAAPEPEPAPAPAPAPVRPGMRKWLDSQAERARAVRDLGALFLRSSER
jgi:signal peptidase I